jgi:hypothetical protein
MHPGGVMIIPVRDTSLAAGLRLDMRSQVIAGCEDGSPGSLMRQASA